MIRILALETTGKYGSAAIIDEKGHVCCASSSGEMNHLKDVITMTEQALAESNCSKSELTHIAASIGPGSFTGIRIGVTTARTMAQMLDLPCLAVSSLEAMAENVKHLAYEKGYEIVVATINARRHQTYAGAWRISDDIKLEIFIEEKQYMIEELLAKLEGQAVYFTGDGIDAYEELIKEEGKFSKYDFADTGKRYQTASTVAKLALNQAKSNACEFKYNELLPNYMRLSEAEQRLNEGTLSDKIKKLSKSI